MGILSDYLDEQQTTGAVAVDDGPGQFKQGLRSGFAGARSQLNAAAGGVAEAAGFDRFAQDRYADMRTLQADAQASAPRVGSYKDVTNLRDAYDYTTGLIGQSVPVSAAAIAGGLLGRTPIGRIATAGAATLPFNTGDVIQRQQNDPVSMRSSAVDRLGQAALSGAGASAFEGLVPGVIAGKIAGRAGMSAASKPVSTILGQGAAGVVGEGLAEGAGEAIKQGGLMLSSPETKFDTDAMLENAIGGAAAGGGLASVGVAADLTRKAASVPGGIVDAAKGAVKSATEAAPDQLAAVTEAFEDKRGKAAQFLDRVLAGESVADLNPLKGKTVEDVRAMMPTLDAERVERMKKYRDELLSDVGLDQAKRDEIAQATTDIADPAVQKIVAGYAKAKEAATDFADKASGFASRFTDNVKSLGGPKKSEDFSGFESALAKEIVPILERRDPTVFSRNNDAALKDIGRGMRQVLDLVSKGGKDAMTSDDIAALWDTFGEDTVEVFDAAARVRGDVDPEQLAGVMNRVMEAQVTEKGLIDGARAALVDPTSMSDGALKKAIDKTIAFVRSTALDGKSPEQTKLAASRIRIETARHFGNKADAFMSLIEKHVKASEPKNRLGDDVVGEDEDGNTIDMRDPNSGLKEKDPKVVSIPYGRFNAEDDTYDGLELASTLSDPKSQSAQALTRAQAEHPGKNVEFLTALQLPKNDPGVKKLVERLTEEIMDRDADNPPAAAEFNRLLKDEMKKYGRVVAEGTPQETDLNKRDLKHVMLKDDDGKTPSSWYKHAARFDADGKAFDAIKLGNWMEKQSRGADRTEVGNEVENKSTRHRRARMFMDGLSSLQGVIGKPFTIPDTTVISHDGMTYGEARRLDMTPEKDAETKRAEKAIAELRKEFKALRAEQKASKIDDEVDFLGRAMGEILQKVEDIRNDLIGKEAYEQTETKDGIGVSGRDYSKENTAELKTLKKRMESLERELNSRTRDNPAFLAKGREIMANFQKRMDRLVQRDEASIGGQRDTLQQERDPFGQVHQALRGDGEAKVKVDAKDWANKSAAEKIASVKVEGEGEGVDGGRTDSSGNPRGSEKDSSKAPAKSKTGPVFGAREQSQATNTKETPDLLREKFAAFAGRSAAAAKVADRGARLLDNWVVLNDSAKKKLAALMSGGTRPADVASAVDALTEKYAKLMGKPTDIDESFLKEDYSGPKTSAEMDAFLVAAKKRRQELAAIREDRDLTAKEDAVYYRLRDTFMRGNAETDLASFYDDMSDTRTQDELHAMLDKAAPEVAAKGPKGEADEYAAIVKSLQGTSPTANLSAADKTAIRGYIDKVLGPRVKLAASKITHAGEYVEAQDLIRISVHSLNPMGVAYHEALHAFFAKLNAQGNEAVSHVLERAAMSAPIQSQLKKLLAGETAALAQLTDPEESAAYMYQFWAAGKLTVGTQAKTIFERIADAFKKVLGVWTNDQRALEILDYFHSGEFKANQGQPSAVANALVSAGRNKALETAKSLTEPLRELADTIGSAGGQRLRDTGIPALGQLADMMKRTSTSEGDDPGFLPAARAERTRVMNALGKKLAGYTEPQINEALEAMQNGVQAASPEARLVQAVVQGRKGEGGLLPTMLAYMRDAGVDVSKLKADSTYFPRVWNTGFIAAHQQEFLVMLEKYKLAGSLKGEPRDILQKLMASDGAEFTIETDRPGMQFLKERLLTMIDHADAAPFMRKNLYEILNSYVTQATRRAEWARRAGDQGENIGDLITAAQNQGASEADLQAARNYIRAVDGTLGDGINPNLRRLQGNVIVYQNIRLLPLAIFSSVVDPMGIMVRGGTVSDAWGTFKRGIAEIPKGFKKDAQSDEATRFAQLVGTIDDAMLVHTLGATYSQGMVGDTGRKLNDTFFRWNLMEQFNSSMRVGATQAAVAFMARHADGTASKHSERWMAELGYAKGEYKPHAPGAEPDDKAKAAINRWVDGAVLRPDAADKPIWMSDPHWALVSHLKQFIYSFHHTILKRVAHEHAHGNYAPAMALASYVPMMIASDAIKGVIQGGGDTPEWKKNWSAGDHIWNGVERSGLLGVTQFAADMGSDIKHGGVGIGALTGPAVGQLVDAVQVVGGREQGARFVMRSMPANALYAGLAKGGGEADRVTTE